MKPLYYNGFIIAIVFLLHFMVINPLEKCIAFGVADENPSIKRPESKCVNNNSFKCIGMPSGHSESVVIVTLLLLKLKILNIQSCILIIAIVGLERVFSKRHTIQQVIAGWTIGLIFSMIYIYAWKKYSVSVLPFISIAFILLLSLSLTSIIDKRVQEPIPAWIKDPSLLPIIEKKQNVSYWMKYIYSILPIAVHSYTPFYSWPRLENTLDRLLEKIKASNSKIDVIVGIKSGGAIVASYIHTKMPDKQLYFFKSKSSKKTNKSMLDVISSGYESYVQKTEHTLTVVEGIADNISDKNVLLIDETIDSGQTMAFAKEYLEKEKNVASVLCATLFLNKKFMKPSLNLEPLLYYSDTEHVTIFPWGYDN